MLKTIAFWIAIGSGIVIIAGGAITALRWLWRLFTNGDNGRGPGGGSGTRPTERTIKIVARVTVKISLSLWKAILDPLARQLRQHSTALLWAAAICATATALGVLALYARVSWHATPHQVVSVVALVLGLLASGIAIYTFGWPLFERYVLYRPVPAPATKADTDAIAQQMEDIQGTVTRLAQYLDGLPEAKNPVLRAAFEEGRLLQQEGEQAQSAQKYNEAIQRFTRALPLAETDAQRAALHVLRGNSYFSISDYQKAQVDYEETLNLYDHILPPQEAEKVRATALGNLGNVYRRLGKLDEAEQHYEQALKIDREIDNRLGEADQLGSLGDTRRYRGDLGQAEYHLQKALAIHKDLGDRSGEAQDLTSLGNVYLPRGGLDRAEEHYRKALEIHREIGNRRGEATALGNLGDVYRRRGELNKAEEHHKKALKIDREIGNRLGEANQVGHLGHVYRLRGNLGKAEEKYKKALGMYTEIGYRRGEAYLLYNLGIVYADRNQLDKAQEHYRKALDIHMKMGNRLGQASALGKMGILYVQHGDREEARNCLQQAQAIYQETGAGGEEPGNVRRALEELERRQQERGE